MKSRKLPSGSKQSLESVFDNVQSDQQANLTNRVKLLFDSLGLNLDFVTGSDQGNDFAMTVQGTSDEQLAITSGKALTESIEYINFTGQTVDLTNRTVSDGQYIVALEYKMVKSDPVTVMQGFLYDATGNEDYTDRNTKIDDSYKISFVSTDTDIATSLGNLTDKQIGLAVVQVSTDSFDTTSWSFDGETASGGLIDLRDRERLAFASTLFDDSTFFFKDRNNTGSYSVTGNTEFNGDVTMTGNVTTDTIQMSAGNEENTNIQGTSASVFNVSGQPVVLSKGQMTNTKNLRIYDINPTVNRQEPRSYVQFRWNYQALDLSIDSTIQATVQDTNFENETVDLSGGDVVGKQLYFTATQNKYEITGVTSVSGAFEVTIDGDLSPESATDASNPARIVDSNVDQYAFKIKDPNSGYSYIRYLDSSYIDNPQYSEKLELGREWNVTIQPLNRGRQGTIHAMPSGSYDPDHSGGGQTSVTYGSTFTNELPDIAPAGSINLEADGQGFLLNISGWRDDTDPENTAHEFEIIYSAKYDLDESDFNNLSGGDIEHQITKANQIHVSAGRPTNFSVVVRPLQNGQPVADAAIGTVTSGGGGILPTEQPIVIKDVNIEVIEAEIDTVTGNQIDVLWYDYSTGAQFYPPSHYTNGWYFNRLDGSSNVLNDEYRVDRHYDITNTGKHRLIVNRNDNLSATTRILSGVSKSDRQILKRELEVDFRIRKIEFDIASARGVTQADPGIIRVYQEGFENSARTLEIEGYSTNTITQEVNFPIKTDSSGSRVLIVDGWDPDNTSPNNDCDFKGTISITGTPIASNELS